MHAKLFRCSVLLVHFLTGSCTKLKIGGASWIVENQEKSLNLSAIVPGGIYSDLMRENMIEDVFYGFNDIETRWVSKMDWNYSTKFSVPEDMMSYKTIKLVLEGVDTFSTIYLNDYKLGSTNNMFVKYTYNIKPYLKDHVNHLQVRFKSAVNKAKVLFEEQSKNYSVVPLCTPDEYNGECHVNHIRKTQASFSWDWGPAIPSMGIYKDIYLEGYNSAIIRDVTVKVQNNSANFWDIEVRVYLQPSQIKIKGDMSVVVHTDNGEFLMKSENFILGKNEHGDYLVTLNGQIEKSRVKLWWPNGYGNQPLYSLVARYNNVHNTEHSEKSIKIGFRTIDLCEDEVENGNLFYFKVNNVPIYAKGSNNIPISILPELAQNEDNIKFLLESAKDVHMNMIRVWGGGNYEADVFYELADEYGILLWQDFLFACNMYPATKEFLSNVRAEVRDQVRRLQHHASIIVWAGNNENRAALVQNWYGTADNYELFKYDYLKLYAETIKNELLHSDDTRPYLTSSPSNGRKAIEEDFESLNPQSNNYGDIHFYNYNNDGWNTEAYPIPRFSSEYGYQSLPSVDTLLTATNNPSDLLTTSEFLQKRQHLPEGFSKMDTLIGYQLTLPDKDCQDCYKEYIYKSQVVQAMSVKVETEFNRQWRSIFTKGGLYMNNFEFVN
ncbi:hypothetical protein PPYR_01214 [Photinus pyralis]|uniref:beta-mannosidase n=1 Tax=Photinus pyralis TaxID=7054 RepID=A0A5N4B3W7_PHOPY|nr:hypothetical protein PPYR_01214 [Photinus pyralis]